MDSTVDFMNVRDGILVVQHELPNQGALKQLDDLEKGDDQ